MEPKIPEHRSVTKAVTLWLGFLKTQESNKELALIFCKGALLSLRDDLSKAKGLA